MRKIVLGLLVFVLSILIGCSDKANENKLYTLFELLIINPDSIEGREKKQINGFNFTLSNSSYNYNITGGSRSYPAKDYSIIDKFNELSNETLEKLSKKYNVEIHESSEYSSNDRTYAGKHIFNHQNFGHGQKWMEINGVTLKISYTVGNIVDDNYGYHREDPASIDISLNLNK